MAKLAIKGHLTRGEEVIEILEMLGGINSHNLYGDENYTYYTIDDDKEIKGGIYVFGDEPYTILTLEEFLKKFPYKVGDEVTLDNFPCEIKGMSWEYDDIIYYVKSDDFSKGVYSKDKDLQPYTKRRIFCE